MTSMKWIILAAALPLLAGCGQNEGDSAWNQGSTKTLSNNPLGPSASTRGPFFVTLSTDGLGTLGVVQHLSAVVTGGTPPYKFIFSYTSIGLSSCPNSFPIPAVGPEMVCPIVLSSSGAASVTISDSSGAMVSSSVLALNITGTTPLPTPYPTPAPTPIVPPPGPTPLPLPIPLPTQSPVPVPAPTPVPTPVPTPLPPTACKPTPVSIGCTVRQVCANGVAVAFLTQNITMSLNVTAAVNTSVTASTANLTIASQGYSNLQLSGPYFYACLPTGAWNSNGFLTCQVDELVDNGFCMIQTGGGGGI